jgi:hypothetical protein
MANSPAAVMMIASPVAKIGRSIKKDEMFISRLYLAGAGGG